MVVARVVSARVRKCGKEEEVCAAEAGLVFEFEEEEEEGWCAR